MTTAIIKRENYKLADAKVQLISLSASLEVFNREEEDVFTVEAAIETLSRLEHDQRTALHELLGISEEAAIEKLLEDNQYFQELLRKTKAMAQRLMAELRPEKKVNPNNEQPALTLPPIVLPKFDGNHHEWVYFREAFTKLVIDNGKLQDFEKLHYLESTLEGEAKGLKSTNDTLDSLWAALKKRYEMKRVIVERHINELYDMKPIVRESSVSLRQMLATLTKNIRVLETLELSKNSLSEQLLHTLVCNRLDPDTRKALQNRLKPDVLPKFDDLIEFLEQRCHVLESIENSCAARSQNSKPAAIASSSGYTKTQKQPPIRTHSFMSHQKLQSQCILCNQMHYLNQCKKFLSLSPSERHSKVKENKLCYNCFSHNHSVSDCKSSLCRKCNSKHHTLLHLESKSDETPKSEEIPRQTLHLVTPTSAEASPIDRNNCFLSTGKRVILSTAILLAVDVRGMKVNCRAVLDSASEVNLVSESMAQTLGVKKKSIIGPVFGLEDQKSVMKSKIVAKIESRSSDYKTELEFLVTRRITLEMPALMYDTKSWPIPANLQLADPHFNVPTRVDMLLGAEIYYDILNMRQMRLQDGLPILQDTKFGWIVGGKLEFPKNCLFSSSNPTNCAAKNPDDDLIQQVKRFWELESCQAALKMTGEEREAELHFQKTHRRQADGRYVVNMPTKPNVVDLGDTKQMALRRFLYLERRLNNNKELKQQYSAFIDEYLALGHMSPSNLDLSKTSYETPTYFLPHHCVIKPESSSTKLRVVFDGSAKSSSGLSLNDVLAVGPTVQQELFEIMVRFRTHKYAYTADVGKMYRQIRVDESQHNLQQILWRPRPQDDIKSFSLETVTYGTASAPFLATRALQQLAEDEKSKYPLAARITKRDFYVDDLLSGADSIQEALDLQKQLVEMLECGGFELHKWCANTPELLAKIPIERREQKVDLSENATVKTLGLAWHPSRDVFVVSIDQTQQSEEIATKRSILSEIARLFDPLGITGPIIVTAKIYLQKLWEKQLAWDQPLPEEDQARWLDFRCQLKKINHVEISRCIIPNPRYSSIFLLGFCDASMAAYGACVYVHCVDVENRPSTTLLCSKSRVAPLKTITIPRLELCSAVLLAQLMSKVKAAMEINFDKIILFSDSTIVLSWINMQSNKMKTFVSHRIAEIQELTNPPDWHHISTQQNPADIISRGLMPNELADSTLWWSGPQFLTENEENWPISKFAPETELPEMKIVLVTMQPQEPLPIFSNCSSFSKLQRIFAYVSRFVHNCRNPASKNHQQVLQATEMADGLTYILRVVQQEQFTDEYQSLLNDKAIDKKSKLIDLNLFLDDKKVMRVGGRIRNSQLKFDTKHQVVLPDHHPFTKTLIRFLHEIHGHVGQQALLAIVRQQYWPVRAKNVVRNVTRRCVRCFRCSPKLTTQFTGDLPSYRTIIQHPFINTGVDYAGPITLKLTRRTSTKAYICIFVCMATKAVHIELVSELSSKAFLAALTRFISRRGHCLNLYSDNGTNFVGAKTEMALLYAFLEDQKNQNEISNVCANNHTQFHFIPPRAPHFGGLWEAAVKSAKYHLTRIVGSTPLTFEEMTTVLSKIEAILNSRPLIPESADPEDVSALTPGHFLVGRPLVALAEPNLLDIADNRLTRWQLLQKITQHFWKRWSTEYLTTLQKRSKISGITNIAHNMVVLVREDNLPPTQWLLGKIVDLRPGLDGVVRVVSIKTKNGIFQRPTVKICILPIQDNEK